MKKIAPNYYKSFSCIADRCQHSCCIGWEIDIDEDSLDYYKSIDGEISEFLSKNIENDGETAHFRLIGEEERCPFLQKNGLCRMILTLGEESLCHICREHPRFYHEFSDREEVGLGLCCEEAARLILSQEDETFLEILEDDGFSEETDPWEKTLLSKREDIFTLLSDREKSIESRATEMLMQNHIAFPQKSPSEWSVILNDLEQLDPSWSKSLETLPNAREDSLTEFELPFEKLLTYFIYRHTADAMDEEDFASRVTFAYFGYLIIRLLCSAKKEIDGVCTFSDLADFARRFSSEIEYSEENTEILLEIL